MNRQKPNIVILLADDQGWGDVGYHGSVIDTPNIDRLTREGMRLENFHVCPLCSPTRAGLMTGRWPIRYGMGESVITPWREYGLPTTERTLAEMLADGGYERRGIFGKWHLGHYEKKYLPLNRGFTHHYGHYNGNLDYFTHKREGELDWHRQYETCRDEGYSTDLIGREGVRFIEESPNEHPFFLYVPFNAPHMPLQAKDDDIDKYRDKIKDRRRRVYAAMVDSMDQAIGGILDAIEAKGIAENTFVLYFSDNGGVTSLGSNGPWRGGKGTVYEGGIRVPAVMRWPGVIPAGGQCHAMTGLIDIYPTLKRIAGLTKPDPNPLDGRDMLEVILGRAKAPRRDWFSYIAQGRPDSIAVYDGQWKLVVLGDTVLEVELHADGTRKDMNANISVELFRLDEDPGEEHDLTRTHPGIACRLLARLKAFRRLKIAGVPHFMAGREQFVAPKDWVIED